MVDDRELRDLIDRARERGAIIRCKVDASDCVTAVSIGKVPGGKYRRIGEPGAGWMPPIAAAERLRELLPPVLMSQATVIGLPQPRTWDDFEKGCLATFGGGHTGEKYDAFQHGMQTVFNLLRAEFPPAEACKATPEILEALRRCVLLLSEVKRLGDASLVTDNPSFVRDAKAAIAKAEGATKNGR